MTLSPNRVVPLDVKTQYSGIELRGKLQNQEGLHKFEELVRSVIILCFPELVKLDYLLVLDSQFKSPANNIPWVELDLKKCTSSYRKDYTYTYEELSKRVRIHLYPNVNTKTIGKFNHNYYQRLPYGSATLMSHIFNQYKPVFKLGVTSFWQARSWIVFKSSTERLLGIKNSREILVNEGFLSD